MRFPEPLKKGDLIGITATSSGVTGVFNNRLDNAEEQVRGLGYRVIETPSVRRSYKLTSASSEQRVREFKDLYLNKEVKVIIPPWGGQFLMDILPLLDFEAIKAMPPKWFQTRVHCYLP